MTVRILEGDCRDILRTLPDESVHCIVTSPPYFGLRDYGVDGQMGLEANPEEFIAGMVAVFRECRRVLRDDGTLWLNIGDSYSGGGRGGNPVGSVHTKQGTNAGSLGVRDVKRSPYKDKDLIGVPWMLAFALRADGWYLRQDIIWSKPNPMPESVTDRCTKAHEYVFLLSKSARYHFDADAIAEPASPNTHARLSQDIANQVGSFRANGGNKTNGPMKAVGRKGKYANPDAMDRAGSSMKEAACLVTTERNKRSVWTIATQPFKEAHFATFPPALVEPCILAGCPSGGTVLDPFGGAGTTGLVADRLQRDAILIELNPEYAEIARRRIAGDAPLFAEVV
jgi:DNA modification methylase